MTAAKIRKTATAPPAAAPAIVLLETVWDFDVWGTVDGSVLDCGVDDGVDETRRDAVDESVGDDADDVGELDSGG